MTVREFAAGAGAHPSAGYNRASSWFPGDWSNGYDGGLQNRRLGFDSLVPRLIRAVIFDLDGLLLDSESAWDGGRRALVAEHRLEWPDGATEAMLGMSAPEWSRYVQQELGVPLEPEAISERVVEHVLRSYDEALPLLPGAEAAVERIAARWPLALASSSNKEVIEHVMATSGWGDVFRAWVSSEEVGRGKPAPDVFLEAARRIGVEPADAAGVEDSHNGILAAKAAGLRTIAIPNHDFPPGEDALSRADMVLGGLDELTPGAVAGG
jgi:HAD superfamily hydrolase (TIGR01509 family)